MSSEVERPVVEVVEPVEKASVSRFLKNRTVKHVDSDYHPTHNKDAVADIPDLIEDRRNRDHACAMEQDSTEDSDREYVEIGKPESRVSERDVQKLKQETSHLPFDTVLKILAHYHYNVPIAIAAAQQMSVPEYMGQGARRIFAANVVYERDKNPTRMQPGKEFYLASKFRKHCDTKTLVNFYYQEKNRIDSNWRLERDDDGPMTSEERAELQEKMLAGGIRFCRRDQNGPYKGRNKRSQAARRAHQLRREQQPGCSKDRDEVDSSDAVSVASSCHSQAATSSEIPPQAQNPEPRLILKLRIPREEIPIGESAASPAEVATSSDAPDAPEVMETAPEVPMSPLKPLNPATTSVAPESQRTLVLTPEPSSESSTSSSTSTSTTTLAQALPPIPKFRFNLKIEDIFPSTSTSSESTSSTSENPQKVKKVYKKKTIEELRGGAQKTYPDRERRPRKIFE